MHPNERLIRDFYREQRRFYAGEASSERLEALLAPDVVWHVPGRSAIAGEHRGREGVLRYFERRRDVARNSFRIEPGTLLAGDELVVHFATGRAEIDGSSRRWETIGVFRIAGGRIAECRLLPFDQYAFDEIWS